MSFDYRDLAANTPKWYNDFNERSMTIICEYDEGEEITLPALYVVCSTCRGKGSHVNPSIDSHGITSDEWHNEWSEEDRSNYMRGVYSIPCYECNGTRVVPDIDKSNFNKKQEKIVKKIEQMRRELYLSARESLREREMGY